MAQGNEKDSCDFCAEYYRAHGHHRSGFCFGCEAQRERDYDKEAERALYEAQF